ncbi:cysteine synthase [Lentzea aerocolonigenes]|uniref:Cysteine synthase n=1 Tax=Lentzea aerocolonigenes TaxID=68170 RepID=A0A0F0H871_LENAE|nr:2,3-diaminopropionate biosynthesis protein SbnA [Lentzea aerocolonigenes]KJK51705.1 cysteine synthase [Lentzea aerocolonigenes]
MPVISAPHQFVRSDVYVDLRQVLGRGLYLKVEGLNLTGSVKLKTAASMVAAAEADGRLGPDSVLVESSSGNLGLALGAIAAASGHRFVCVTDIRCNPATVKLLRAMGTEVVVLSTPDRNGGFLAGRIAHVRQLCASDDRYLWLNQYENEANWMAHRDLTAAEVAAQFPGLDVLFAGAGTGGTLTGCVKFFQDKAPEVRVVAVDAVGSVSFGGQPGPRLIPGLGTSTRPPLLDPELPADVVHVSEQDTVRYCRMLAAKGFLFGGSTGTVVAGAMDWLSRHDPDGRLTAVVISPDLAERYVDTVYDDNWVSEHFGPELATVPGRVLS